MSSSYNNSNNSDLFTHSSVLYRSNPNSLGLYEVGNVFPKTNNIEEESAYKIMNNSVFYLNFEYNRYNREVEIKYSKIAYFENNNEEKLISSIKDIKEIRAEDISLNLNYLKFINFLNEVESEIKAKYRKNNIIEIELQFNLEHPEKEIYKLRCFYTIKNNINLKETEFKDEDILNNGDNDGLYYMLETLSEE